MRCRRAVRGRRGLCVGLCSLLQTGPAGADPNHVVEELYQFIASQPIALSGEELRVCNFGLGEHTLDLSRRILADTSPPPAHAIFVRADGGIRQAVEELAHEYIGRVHATVAVETLDRTCNLVVLAVDDPRFHAEDIRAVAGSAENILIVYPNSHCSYERARRCQFFHATWKAMTWGLASCGQNFCAATVPTNTLEDQLLSMVDCSGATAFGGIGTSEAPASPTSQWQQDWFVYENFIRGTVRDTDPRSKEYGGIFVDVGAFNPVHLSNTAFFERCLGWRGLCVEPNPSAEAQFRAYRPRSTLVQNCVWSKPRTVTMSYQKDPIEAYIREEEGGASGASQHLLVQDGEEGRHPEFKAECRTLQDILASSGLSKPVTVDYLSVDAEAAEAEIFRDFPFEDFDISVISVEVQVRNYYEIDVIFLSAGYAKVGVLGGDHVYTKLDRAPLLPAGTAEWHKTLNQDFYSHAAPKTKTLQEG